MKAPLRNLVSLLGGDVAMRAIGFVVTAYLARVLEPAGFGMIGVGMAVLGYLQLIGSPGIQVLETRNVAASAHDLPSRAGAVLSLRLLLALILIGITGVVLWLWVDGGQMRAVVLLHALSLLPMALLLDWVLQGKERFAPFSLARALGYVAYAVAVFAFVRGTGDVTLAPVCFLVGNVVTTLLVGWMVAKEHAWIVPTWNPGMWASIMIENLPVGGALVLGQMVVNFPPLLIAWVLTTPDVGVYSAAMKLTFLFLFVDRILNFMLLPMLTRQMTTRPAEVPRLFALSVKLVLLGAIPLALCGIIISPLLMELVFGTNYAGGALILRILMGYVAFTLVNTIFTCVLLAAKREKAYLRMMSLGAVVLVAATVVMTLAWGLTGTAVGVVLGEGATMCLMGWEASSVAAFRLIHALIKPVAGAVGMAAVAWILWTAHPVVVLLTSFLLFILIVIVTRALSPEEIRFLKERLA
jgi:O-antigen/teichoic acid export membrane protein